MPPLPRAARSALASSALAALLAACGGTPEPQQPRGPDPCEGGKAHLTQRLGPELSRFVTTAALPAAHGCALVYLKVAEEMPEEMPDGEDLDIATDHELAFAFTKGNGVTVDPVARSTMAPGPVVLKLSSRDITGDNVPDLVVEEQQGEYGMTKYRGLRIFDWSRGTGRELFAERLEVTTPEGLTIVPEWKVGTVGSGERAIIFDGAGTQKLFVWKAAQNRFVHTESVTPDKPAPAAAPAATPAEKPALKKPAEKKPADKDPGGNVLEELGL